MIASDGKRLRLIALVAAIVMALSVHPLLGDTREERKQKREQEAAQRKQEQERQKQEAEQAKKQKAAAAEKLREQNAKNPSKLIDMPALGFSLRTAQGWQLDSKEPKPDQLTLLLAGAQRDLASLSITSRPRQGKFTLAELAAGQQKAGKWQGEPATGQLDGIETVTLTGTAEDGKQQRHMIALHDGKEYRLWINYPASMQQRAERDVEQMLASVKWTKSAEQAAAEANAAEEKFKGQFPEQIVHFDKIGVEFTMPAGWKSIPVQLGWAKVYSQALMVPGPDGQPEEDATFHVSYWGHQGDPTPERALLGAEKLMNCCGKHFVFGTESDGELAGLPARYLLIEGNESGNKPYRGIAVLAVRGQNIYLFQLSTVTSRLPRLRPKAEEIFKSVKWIEINRGDAVEGQAPSAPKRDPATQPSAPSAGQNVQASPEVQAAAEAVLNPPRTRG